MTTMINNQGPKILIIVGFFLVHNISFGFQENNDTDYYVNAENGLNFRKNINGDPLFKLVYGTKVQIISRTGDFFFVESDNINGEWVRVKLDNKINSDSIGIVHDGYLTKEKLFKKIPLHFDLVDLVIDNIDERVGELDENYIDRDTIFLKANPDSLRVSSVLRILKTRFKDKRPIKILQSFDIVLPKINDNPNCDFTVWDDKRTKIYKLPQNNNEFQTDSIGFNHLNRLKRKYENVISRKCHNNIDDIRVALNAVDSDDLNVIRLEAINFELNLIDSQGYKSKRYIIISPDYSFLTDKFFTVIRSLNTLADAQEERVRLLRSGIEFEIDIYRDSKDVFALCLGGAFPTREMADKREAYAENVLNLKDTFVKNGKDWKKQRNE